ncbi:hypothetical protein L1987_32657 [Smallanthus sonchifolius]|uniref:Uncharacterized protein n=1 Tax=Smallanthus sonchifolius TaxID=185202 RepID=A0ACB9HNV7_9ASTR|nr:hypothetical protein L1987_32657 [Smallanthus sonchifolius]
MDLEYKHPHNVLPFLEKHADYPEKDAMHRQLDGLSSSESSEEEGDKEKEENFFGNEEELDSSDNNEIPADTEVPLAKSQVPISEWYYDQELKRFVIKRLDFTYSTFYELGDLSVLYPAECKLLSLIPISTTTEEGTKLQKRIRQSVWTIRDGYYQVKRETGVVDIYNSIDIVCLDVNSLLNLAELQMENLESDEKAEKSEKIVKEFAKVYKEANK